MGLTKWLRVLRIVPLSACLCLVGPSLAVGGDLLSSLDCAWSQDPVLQSAVQAHQTSLTRIPQARAPLLPVINLTTQNNVSNGSYVFSGGAPTSRPIRSNSQTVQLTQALYHPQKRHALVQSELQAVQTLAQLNQAEQDLMLRMLQAYGELQTAKSHQDVVAAQLKLQAQQLLVVQRGLNFGTHAQPDLDEARSKYATVLAQVVDAATQWRIKRQEVVKMTGESSQKGDVQWSALSDNFSVQAWADKANEKDRAEWMDQARVNAPAVRAQMAALEIAFREILKNRAAHLPTLDFTASYAHNLSTGNASNEQNFDSSSRVTQYGVQLTIPIFAGGGTSAKVRESVAAWEKAQFDLDTAQQQAESAVLNAFESVEAAKAQMQALQIAIEAAQSAIQGNLTGVRVGKRTLLNVYDSEQQLATVRRDWRKARYDLLLQIAKLKASAGLLEREDFMALNEGFQLVETLTAKPQNPLTQ
jgi:outer membrane protein